MQLVRHRGLLKQQDIRREVASVVTKAKPAFVMIQGGL